MMKKIIGLALLVNVGSHLLAMPPWPGISNPIYDKYASQQYVRGIDRFPNPVRDFGKKGIFNRGDRSVEMLVSGTKNIIAVCIRFTNYGNIYITSTFQDMLFGSWPSGSVKEYYTHISYGNLTLAGMVKGWFTANAGRSSYGIAAGMDRAALLVKEAAMKADTAINYALYDDDQDGYVDLFTVIHAGFGCEETGSGDDIWSHSWQLSSAGYGTYQSQDPDPNHPGQYIKIDNYTIQPERSNISNNATLVCIGVFAHEWGHAFGLPDLYDTDPYDDNDGAGLGTWCLMAAGSWGGDFNSPWAPSHLSIWGKRDIGWLVPTMVKKDSVCTVKQVETNAQGYLLPSASSASEFYLIENRQQADFDSTIHNAGLCIYHIDQEVIDRRRSQNLVNAGGNYPYGVAMEQADGLNHLWSGANYGDTADVYPGALNKTAFDSSGTNPDSRTNDGLMSACGINQISATDSVMQAHLYYPGSLNLALPVIQDPVMTEHLEIWIAPNRVLTDTPIVQVEAGGDNTQLPVTFVEHTICGRAAYTLADSGMITVSVQTEGIDTHRTFTALHLSGCGTIRSPDGAVCFEVPDGSFPTAVWLTILQESSAADVPPFPVYTIGPDAQRLVEPARLTISYDGTSTIQPGKLGIYHHANGQWEYCGGWLDPAEKTVSIITSRTGSYQIRYDPQKPDLKSVDNFTTMVAPNPSRGSFTVVFHQPARATMRFVLYDPTGRRVEELAAVRDAEPGIRIISRSRSKPPLQPGVYFLVVSAGAVQDRVKLVVTE